MTQTVAEEALIRTVLDEIAGMLRGILDEYGLDDVEIEMASRFHEDLELESIDLVSLGGLLESRYGDRVNFAEFIAGLELDDVIALTVGTLVEYVAGALSGTGQGRGA